MPDSKDKKIKTVSCLGFADALPHDKVYTDAFEVGKILAQNGYAVADGGGPGVMRAATMGAESAGGETIGVTFYPKDITNFLARMITNEIQDDLQVFIQPLFGLNVKVLCFNNGSSDMFFRNQAGTLLLSKVPRFPHEI